MKFYHLVVFIGLSLLMILLTACPRCDNTVYPLKIIDVVGEHRVNANDEGNIPVSGSTPAATYTLLVYTFTDVFGKIPLRNNWSVIPSAYAFSCPEDFELMDSVHTVRISSTSSFGAEYPAGTDLSGHFKNFDYYEFEEQDFDTRNNWFYLLEMPEEELEHKFIIEIETELGDIFVDTTEAIILTL